jgi:hypothetical protein
MTTAGPVLHFIVDRAPTAHKAHKPDPRPAIEGAAPTNRAFVGAAPPPMETQAWCPS